MSLGAGVDPLARVDDEPIPRYDALEQLVA
jgi:hypothetical protein